MIAPRFVPLVLKHVVRHRLRTLLTVGGIGVAMFLFCTVQAFDRGVREATQVNAGDNTLVVYRENRYCPFTSNLPHYYQDRIRATPGVRDVIPMRIVVNNCRTALDVVTFRGVPEDGLAVLARDFEFLSGSLADWEHRSDAVILGEVFANRRGLRPGQTFDAVGLTVYVAGVFRSTEPQHENVGYVHLSFLQQAAKRGGDGIVTQFTVKVNDPTQMEAIAAQIDDQFRADPEPTHTRPEKAFIARAAVDIIAIARFTRWLGVGALLAVLALVANAIVLSVRDRVKQYAIYQTLGFRGGLIARLVVVEGLVISLIGGLAGAAGSLLYLQVRVISISVEGVSMNVQADPLVALVSWLLAAGVGVAASLLPAWEAQRRSIAESFRAI